MDIENVLKVWLGVSAIIVIFSLWDSIGYWKFGLPKLFQWNDPFRPIATFRNPPQLGIFLFTTFFVALSTYFLHHLRRRNQWLLLILMSGVLVASILTTRRSILLAYLGGIVAVLVFKIRYVKTIIPIIIVLLIGSVILLKTLQADQKLFDYFLQRLSVFTPEVLEDKPFLMNQLKGGWEAFIENPISGIGYGRYAGSEYDLFGSDHEIHSTYLQILAETGVFGIIAYSLFLLSILKICYDNAFKFKDVRWAQFSITLYASFFGFMISYAYNRHLRERYFWILIAVIVAIHRLAQARYLAYRSTQTAEVISRDAA